MMRSGGTYSCPPLVGLVANGLFMSLPVGVDVWANVWDFGAILETGSDRVENRTGGFWRRRVGHVGGWWL